MSSTDGSSSSNGGADGELQVIGGVAGFILAAGILALAVLWARSWLRARAQRQANAGAQELDESGEANLPEPHFEGAAVVRDVVVGLSDGLTVPFALTAGLASLSNSRFVVLAGMSELVAGCISMGLGGYLAGRAEIEHYDAEEAREWHEVKSVPNHEESEIVSIFQPYGVSRDDLLPILARLKANHALWVDFMMKYELNLEKPEKSRLWISALTIGGSYFMGGLVPLFPYIVIPSAETAFYVSIGCTLAVLFIFGYIKASLIGVKNRFKSAFEMMIVGAAAAGAAFGIAKALPQPSA
ncbi:hypothetical protein HDU83_003363 [Entophlyctis luteolus]|nr:hypothetical protein HDU82_000891 [Entophlyctis luteolus]KAJ3346128.1 hypothetical protein HDU83_003363 [Entophlyctis luteolus]